MASFSVIPGFGGAVDITLTGGVTSDVFDMSLCESFAIEMISESGAGASGQPQQSFTGTGWANLGAAISAVATPSKFDITDQPHGLIRIVQTAAGGDQGVYRIVGFGSKAR